MFDHTSYDFGTVARGAKVEHRFGVENIYLEDAHIESARRVAAARRRKCPSQILKTWKKDYVVAKVDTVNFQGQKDVTITVEFDRPFPAEVQLNIHCYIRSDVVLQPGSVHLRAAQGTAAQQRVIVRYAGRPDWQIQRVESANPNITGKVVEISRGGGMVTYDLTVNLAAGAKAGYSRDELNLVTNDPNPRAQRVPVPVEAVVVAPVTRASFAADHGPRGGGQAANPVMRPLVVVSTSPFQITRVESTNPRFRCDLPRGRGGHNPPLARRLPWRRHAGQGRHANSHSDNRFGGTDRGRSEHQLDSARRRGKDGRQAGPPRASRSRASRSRAPDGVDPVFGPPARLPSHDLPPHRSSSHGHVMPICARRIDAGRSWRRCRLPRGPTNRRRRPRISSTARRWKAGR